MGSVVHRCPGPRGSLFTQAWASPPPPRRWDACGSPGRPPPPGPRGNGGKARATPPPSARCKGRPGDGRQRRGCGRPCWLAPGSPRRHTSSTATLRSGNARRRRRSDCAASPTGWGRASSSNSSSSNRIPAAGSSIRSWTRCGRPSGTGASPPLHAGRHPGSGRNRAGGTGEDHASRGIRAPVSPAVRCRGAGDHHGRPPGGGAGRSSARRTGPPPVHDGARRQVPDAGDTALCGRRRHGFCAAGARAGTRARRPQAGRWPGVIGANFDTKQEVRDMRQDTRIWARGMAILLAAARVLAVSGGAIGAPAPASRSLVKVLLVAPAVTYDPLRWESTLLAANAWKQLGIDVEVRPFADFASLTARHSREPFDFDAFVSGYVGRPERLDPDALLYGPFHSKGIFDNGPNYFGYANPEYDRIVESQRKTARVAEVVRPVVEDALAVGRPGQPGGGRA